MPFVCELRAVDAALESPALLSVPLEKQGESEDDPSELLDRLSSLLALPPGCTLPTLQAGRELYHCSCCIDLDDGVKLPDALQFRLLKADDAAASDDAPATLCAFGAAASLAGEEIRAVSRRVG